ncbi:uncharacterized protein LOC116800231 [Drosophila sechellia]|nr:uncharacterized protein LOC116800231 [Drosophila sechellia]XP_033155291.1 uncharacterized protein LOC117137775 [Drosophila mauritiana]
MISKKTALGHKNIILYILHFISVCAFLFGRVNVKMRVGGDDVAATTMRAIFSRLAGGTFKMALPGDPRRST